MLLIFNVVHSQNWMPINKNEKYNYCSGNNLYKTIWIDSIKIINNDSVFFFNKIIKKVKDSKYVWPDYARAYYLENQSQFFLSQIIYSANSGIVMKENDSIRFLIKAHAKLNDTWVFDSLKNVTAIIVDASIKMLFEHMDSIKVIKLSNNDTIVLSKNYGILKFPIFDTSHQHMNLVGIEGRNIGLVIPKFKDFYNFKVGDVFCYEIEDDVHRYYSKEYKKITIKSKIITGNSITYLNRYMSLKTTNDWLNPGPIYINKDSTFIYH